MPAVKKAKNEKPEVTSIRLKPRAAAKLIGTISYENFLDLCNNDVFTVFDNGKRGTLRRIQVLREEVELYANHGEDALREHRAKKRRSARR